jgi:hypothetical protein
MSVIITGLSSTRLSKASTGTTWTLLPPRIREVKKLYITIKNKIL